jgi:hypothetical protein
LQVLIDLPNADLEGEARIGIGAKNQQVKINILDNFGTLFTGVKSVKATLEQVDEK